MQCVSHVVSPDYHMYHKVGVLHDHHMYHEVGVLQDYHMGVSYDYHMYHVFEDEGEVGGGVDDVQESNNVIVLEALQERSCRDGTAK